MTPLYIGSVQGSTNQVQRLHKLSISRKEESDWFCKVDNKSDKVIKKNNLRSGIDLSLSSKNRNILIKNSFNNNLDRKSVV